MTELLTPLTAPTPSVPSPWYALMNITIIYTDRDFTGEGWGIQIENSVGDVDGKDYLRCEDDVTRPWIARTKECAISHIKYLNGITADFPVCDCETSQ